MIGFYEELEHTADWAVRVWGDSLTDLFEHAGQAMFDLQGADFTAKPETTVAIECQAPDIEMLLVAWLSELLYQSETRNLLFSQFTADIHGEPATGEWRLTGAAGGRHGRGALAHVKAVTYHNLAVQQADGCWFATVTFDT